MQEEEYTEESASAPRYAIASEALVRIEKAKLYQLLLDNDLFGDDAGDWDAIQEVTDEIKGFVLMMLETLIGMRDPSAVAATPTRLPWNPTQIAALTELADKLLERSRAPIVATPVKPAVNTISKSTPTPRPKPAAPAPAPATKPAPQQRQRTRPATSPASKPIIGAAKPGANTPAPPTVQREGDQHAYQRMSDSPLRKPMPSSIEMQGMALAQVTQGMDFVASGAGNAYASGDATPGADSKKTIGNLLLGGIAPGIETVTQGVD